MIRIDGYLIDAALSESYELEAEPSSYPVEDGSDFTDNVRALPKKVSIDGVVTDTPIGQAAIERQQDEALPSATALAKLEKIFSDRLPVTIETSFKVYERMVLTHLTIPRDRATGRALRFSASFQELRIASTERAVVRTSTPRARRKKDLGTQVMRPLDGPVTYFTDRSLNQRGVRWDGEQQSYVDASTGKPLTQDEGEQWVVQNGGDPQYKDEALLGPGAYTGSPGSASPQGGAQDKPGYWPETTTWPPNTQDDDATFSDRFVQAFGE